MAVFGLGDKRLRQDALGSGFIWLTKSRRNNVRVGVNQIISGQVDQLQLKLAADYS